MNTIKIIECPRDAMQGLHKFIPTKDKIRYINSLLKVGYHTIDFGSFVSPKAIPQMSDTKEVLQGLDLNGNKTDLLAIIANVRGAEEALEFEQIQYLGFPFSVSETFQKRNTNKSIQESFINVGKIQELCDRKGKELVIYMSMGFGNPYGDPHDYEDVLNWIEKISGLGIKIFSLADTVGLAKPEEIEYLFSESIKRFKGLEFGVHLHTAPHKWRGKLEAAFKAGCLRYDGAINGFGGCPMANDELIGNFPTEHFITFFDEDRFVHPIDLDAFEESMRIAREIFPSDHL